MKRKPSKKGVLYALLAMVSVCVLTVKAENHRVMVEPGGGVSNETEPINICYAVIAIKDDNSTAFLGVSGINNRGDVFGYADEPKNRPFRWTASSASLEYLLEPANVINRYEDELYDDGSVTTAQEQYLFDIRTYHAYDINDSGSVVGACPGGSLGGSAALWGAGQTLPQELSKPSLSHIKNQIRILNPALVFGINNNGKMLGRAIFESTQHGGYESAPGAHVWDSPQAIPTLLGTQDRSIRYHVYKISGNNTSIGWKMTNDVWKAVVGDQEVSFVPYAINAADHVVGNILEEGKACFWKNNTTEDLGQGWAAGLNDRDEIVGYANNAASIWKRLDINGPFFPTPLSSLVSDQWTVDDAVDINNSGVIAATVKKVKNDQGETIADPAPAGALLVSADIAVDSNRDGTIRFAGNFQSTQGKPTDKTTEARPFRFWLNDDNDGLPNAEGDAIGTGTSDYDDGVIQTARDLEDFARLYVHIGGFYEEIANGTFKIGLKWRDTNGTAPKIKVYKSTDTAGSDSYLKDDTVAFAQVSGDDAEMIGEVAGSGELILDREGLWSGYSEANPKLCLLFEGSGEGKGQLCITIHKSDGTPLGDGPGVWLDLKNIKKMYQRVDSAMAHPWENVAFEADPSEDKKEAVIFVHGWRMSPEGAGNFAESMYKRMWHRGFKGRFAAFHWDTWWHNSAEWVPWVGGAIDAYLANYNDSEYTAWQGAASGLRTFVNGLSFEKKNLIAHSMGNIVAGEALRQGMPVNNYALLNAAVPSACYDEDETRIRQATQYTHSAGPLFFSMWDSQTPDNDADPATRNLAYRGTFKDIGTSTTLINFFLPEDQATSFAWEVNNDQTKPPMNNGQQSNASLVTNFEYDPSGQPAEKLWKFAISALYPSYYITYKPEAMAYACRTWGKAVGAWGTTQGAVNGGAVNMKDTAFGSPRGFDTEHSAEFNRRIQQLQPFYDRLLDELEVKRNTP